MAIREPTNGYRLGLNWVWIWIMRPGKVSPLHAVVGLHYILM